MGGLMNYFEGYTLLINNSTLSGRFGIVYLIMTKAIVSFSNMEMGQFLIFRSAYQI